MKYLCIIMSFFIVATAQAIELSNEPLFTFGRGVITHLDYSPDSKYLAVASTYSIEILETEGYTLVTSWDAESYEVVFSPDGKTVTSRSDSSIELYEFPSGKKTRLTDNPSPGMAFRKDGRLMAWFNNGTELQIWNIGTKKLEEKNTYDMNGSFFRYSPNREYVVTGFGWNSYAKVLHIPTGKIQIIDMNPLDAFDRALVLTNECLFVPLTGFNVMKYNLVSGKVEVFFMDAGESYCMALSDNERFLALSDLDRAEPTVVFRDMSIGRNRNLVGTGTHGRSRSYYFLTFSHDGRHLALSLGDRLLYWNVAQLGGFGVDMAKEVKAIDGHLMPVYATAFSQDGHMLAVVGEAGSFSIWDVQKNILLFNDTHKVFDYSAGQFIAGKKEIVIGGSPWCIRFVDFEKGNVDSRDLYGEITSCQSMSSSIDGSILAGGITGGVGKNGVYLWDTQTHQLLDKLNNDQGVVTVAFHPKGQWLVAGDDSATIKIWDWQNRKVVRELNKHKGAIRSISFTSDGNRMLSSGDDGLAILWDTQTWSEITRLTFHGNKAVINPQGNLIAMGYSDGKVRLNEGGWIVETTWSHRDRVNAIEFSSDGSMLATASSDGSVKLWAIPVGDNKVPVVKLTSNYKGWQSGALKLTADASDTGGTVASVSFQYSTDRYTWYAIGEDKTAPYEVIWDTANALPIGAESVWLRTIATDNKGGIATASSTESFGISNVGTPSGGMQVFNMPLSPGLHMISLPLRPEVNYTARSFAKTLGASLVVHYDEDAGKFIAFLPNIATIDGFSIKGGQGYIINMPEARQIAFTGAAWSGAPAYSQPSDGLWAYAVGGQLPDGIKAGQLTVINTRSGMQAQAEPQGEGRYGAALVGSEGESVVRLGDTLEIRYGAGVLGRHSVTASDLQLAYGIVDIGSLLPSQTRLFQNYPNPFNPETWIPYQLMEDSEVTLRIYNIKGELIRQLDLGYKPAGFYNDRLNAAYWDGRNKAGEQVSSGLYFYSIHTGIYTAIRKMVITQ